MEPLSVIASVIALGEGISALLDVVQTLVAVRHAPEEVLRLQAELQHVETTIRLANLTPNMPLSISTFTALNSIVTRLKKNIDQTQTIIAKFGSNSTIQTSNDLQMSWRDMIRWKIQSKGILQLTSRIRDDRMFLSEILLASQFSQSLLDYTLLMDIHHLTKTSKAAAENHYLDIKAAVQSMTEPKASSELPDGIQITGSDQENGSLTPLTGERCLSNCKCQCHRSEIFRIGFGHPTFFGQFYFSSTDFLRKTIACNDKKCRKITQKQDLVFFYSFPKWVVNRIFQASLSWDLVNGAWAAINLIFPRIIDGHEIWTAIVRGNLERVRHLLTIRSFHPCDVDQFGETLLLYSILARQWAIANLLMQVDHNVERTDTHGRSAAKWAFGMLRHSAGLIDREGVTVLKHITDSVDDGAALVNEFLPSAIHEALSDSESTCIGDAIELDPECINKQNCLGFSPLYLASRVNNLTAARNLLLSGADANICSNTGWTPLHVAVENHNYDLSLALLESGANVNAGNVDGNTPLHIAARVADVDIISLLLRHGADIHSRGSEGRSVLDRCRDFAKWGMPADAVLQKMLVVLEDAGIDKNTKDTYGNTVLMNSVRFDLHSMYSHLVGLGCDAGVINNKGQSILHIMAQYATLPTMKAMRNLNLFGIDPQHRDYRGLTAQDYFEQRKSMASTELSVEKPRPTQHEQNEFEKIVGGLLD